MKKEDYLKFLEKTSYIEGILRASEANGDIFPLQAVLRVPELKEIIYRHFHFSSPEEFLAAFTPGQHHFYRKLEEQFEGYKILFHSRKIRSEHTVPNTHALYCLRGSCFLMINQEEIMMQEGDTCIIAPNVPTGYCNLSEDALVIHVVLTAAFISEALLPRLPQDYTLNRFFRSVVFDDVTKPYIYAPGVKEKQEDMSQLLATAFHHNTYKPPLWEEMVNSLVTLFFCYMFSSAEEELSERRAQIVPSDVLTQIQDYIADNCRDITLRQLADVFHFNESYLSQYLKKRTGENFTDLLQRARISQAEKLLVNTTLSIVEIADRVGYQNVSYFYKIFFKVNECSPTEYRRLYLASSQRTIGREAL